MRVRPSRTPLHRTATLVAGLGLVVAVTGVSSASQHVHPCVHAIIDQAGDANAPPGISSAANPVFPSEPAYDITYADLATNSTSLTGVIHVLKLATTAGTAPTGLEWRFDFMVGGKQLFVQAIVDKTPGSAFIGVGQGRYGYLDSTAHTLGRLTPVLDLARSEVRMTLPLQAFAGQTRIKPGVRLSDLVASAGRFYNLGASTITEADDHGWAKQDYIAGARSCVRVGG